MTKGKEKPMTWKKIGYGGRGKNESGEELSQFSENSKFTLEIQQFVVTA